MFMVIEPGASGLDKFALLEEEEYLEIESSLDIWRFLMMIEIMIIILCYHGRRSYEGNAV